eukprot:CAMPEP_0195518654 /NCGR_PEP_ID=MMETSP0794_2-20130614/13431_1 /TAXON_ID=515487 /ORGANISM="Stephanopyxis turris, Strain CCMP 815" /LENGTH=209 /DNA_ID=CAMNT_0040647669 /DNA_START=153 /DNA_END=782 /DNA_ORIENTATION=+
MTKVNENHIECAPSLRGRERLFYVVDKLGLSCPWTKSVDSTSMLDWLGGEVEELRKEISLLRLLSPAAAAGEVSMVSSPRRISGMKIGGIGHPLVANDAEHEDAEVRNTRKALVSELGDVLFDAIMLEMMCRRDFNLNPSEAWDAAAEKVERRTPYMKDWGDGSEAKTSAEAELMWQAAKLEEKKEDGYSFEKSAHAFKSKDHEFDKRS